MFVEGSQQDGAIWREEGEEDEGIAKEEGRKEKGVERERGEGRRGGGLEGRKVLVVVAISSQDDSVCYGSRMFACDYLMHSDKELLQRDLDKLSNWARDQQMKFNVETCRVMDIGINNDNVKYFMNGVELSVTITETDLGVMISDDLKSSNPCSKVVKTGNKLVGFTGRTFKHKSEKKLF